ncbi:MAG: metal ABC transporter permease [Lactobacillaceae bacterium]|jgi:zinc/manganese transport system permease protein|nr:metal ABC transporter permease [Lactobacillaceae bacterium]
MFSELGILLPALTAGLLMMIIHVPLGQEVLRRGIIFIDLSLAQLAAMGAVFAGLFGLGFIETQACALVFALLGGVFFKYVEHNYQSIGEAVIGCAFVLSATLVLLAMSGNPHGDEHINDILSGQLLFTSWERILFAGSIFIIAAVLVYRWPDIFLKKYFYPVIAVVITTSVQVCGVYLVFASLIFPAVGTYYIENHQRRRLLEYLGESAGFIGGLLLSFYFDLSTGPAIVWAIAAAMLIIFIISSIKKTYKNT